MTITNNRTQDASAAPEGTLRSGNFDFLRLSLAVLVIYSHSFALLGQAEPPSTLTRGQIDWGKLAVDMFFVISGLLITHSWMNSCNTLRYLRKRALRILPAFAVAVLFCALIVIPIASTPRRAPIRWLELMTGILRLRGYEDAAAFANNPRPGATNGALWSIQFEAWCYIGTAILGLLGLWSLCTQRTLGRLARPIELTLLKVIGSNQFIFNYAVAYVIFNHRVFNSRCCIGLLGNIPPTLTSHGIIVVMPLIFFIEILLPSAFIVSAAAATLRFLVD